MGGKTEGEQAKKWSGELQRLKRARDNEEEQNDMQERERERKKETE